MSDHLATAGCAIPTTKWTVTAPPQAEEPKGAGGLIECVVMTADEIILRPKCELAKSVLSGFVSGEKVFSAVGRGSAEPRRGYGRGLDELRITVTHRPLLTTGRDPHFTGITLSPDEAAYLRDKLDELRASKQKPLRRAAKKRRK